MQIYTQSPDDILDYKFDFSLWLKGGDTIASYTFDITPAGLITELDTNDTSSVTIWLSGGVLGQMYTVCVDVVTSQGRSKKTAIGIRIVDPCS